MPPHLRHGIPVDQRLPRTPQPLFLCTCWQCYSQTAINQVTLEVERGAYVTRDVYRQHLSEDTTRGIAPPIVLNTMVGFRLLFRGSRLTLHSVLRQKQAFLLSDYPLAPDPRAWGALSRMSLTSSPPSVLGPLIMDDWSSRCPPPQHRCQ